MPTSRTRCRPTPKRARRPHAISSRRRAARRASVVACARIAPPADGDESRFHPDFAWLERDLKTSTSAEATRDLMRAAQLSPYEARGQVFVIADAASLSGEAADSLLKAIEEPALSAPRHFLLLAASRFDLPPTLRSRSLALYLGAGAGRESPLRHLDSRRANHRIRAALGDGPAVRCPAGGVCH